MLTVLIDSLEVDERATAAERTEKEAALNLDHLFKDDSGKS